ncbi:hypothetical protein [Leptolyngbya sp. FACHB-16]|uniref:hypothetical protein n=1 Tax=unclassified Leptolyngbya TaxID=2650499 RepID=UPI00168A2357|nr:hypothetical protein [Leptolyngbya sp. FACHB-16]
MAIANVVATTGLPFAITTSETPPIKFLHQLVECQSFSKALEVLKLKSLFFHHKTYESKFLNFK